MFWEVMNYVFITLAMTVILINMARKEMGVAGDSAKLINSLFLLVTIVLGTKKFHELISACGWLQSEPFWRWPMAVLAIFLGAAIWITIFQIIHILPPYETEKEEAKKEEDQPS